MVGSIMRNTMSEIGVGGPTLRNVTLGAMKNAV